MGGCGWGIPDGETAYGRVIALDPGGLLSERAETAKYLRGRLPLDVVYRKEIGRGSEASKEELRIKRMGVRGKLGLLNGG